MFNNHIVATYENLEQGLEQGIQFTPVRLPVMGWKTDRTGKFEEVSDNKLRKLIFWTCNGQISNCIPNCYTCEINVY